MLKPNYEDGSIVNLMSSIKKSFNGTHQYGELKILSSNEISKYKNIILMVLDGVGYNYLVKQHSKKSFLNKNMRGSITSVFPPTTACAIPTFATGLPPQQHALTGWYMLLKEFGIVSTTLKFNPRIGGDAFSSLDYRLFDILDYKNMNEDININSFQILPKILINTDFNIAMRGKSKVLGFSTLKGMSSQILKTVRSSNTRKYIFSYLDYFDATAHTYGVKSNESSKCFNEIEKIIKNISKNLNDTNSLLIVTADHGFIDSKKEEHINLEDHPELLKCLTLPLCGDSRVVYCYVHPTKVTDFENYVNTYLSKFIYLFKSEELIKKNMFGLFQPHQKLFDRIGDYTLILKENYVFKDRICSKNKKLKIGYHSGLSEDELLVPLIIFEFKKLKNKE